MFLNILLCQTYMNNLLHLSHNYNWSFFYQVIVGCAYHSILDERWINHTLQKGHLKILKGYNLYKFCHCNYMKRTYYGMYCMKRVYYCSKHIHLSRCLHFHCLFFQQLIGLMNYMKKKLYHLILEQYFGKFLPINLIK